MTNTQLAKPARRHDVAADPVTVDRFIEQSGWTDGLPVVPPTEELVGAMLQATRHRPEEILGIMDPLKAAVTGTGSGGSRTAAELLEWPLLWLSLPLFLWTPLCLDMGWPPWFEKREVSLPRGRWTRLCA